jgi:hypothetical protein
MKATIKNQKTSKRSSTRPDPKPVQIKPEKPSRDIAELSSAKFSTLTAAREQATSKSKISGLLNRELSGGGTTSVSIVTSSEVEVKKTESSIDDKSVYFVDQTLEGIHFVELLAARRSEELGRADSKVIYWKKSKAFVLEDQQLYKVSLKDFKRTRFGVDLSRVQLDKLREFMAIVVLSRSVIIRQTVHHRRQEKRRACGGRLRDRPQVQNGVCSGQPQGWPVRSIRDD